MWCLTKREDTWISFPLPPALPDKYIHPFFCNSPRHHVHSDKVAKLFYKRYFNFLNLLTLNNPCLFLWNKFPLGSGNNEARCAGSSFRLLSGWAGMEVTVEASMAGAQPRGNSAAFSCSTVRELHRPLQEGGRSWAHSRERLKGSGVLSSGTWSGTKESLFISLYCTGLLSIPYKQLKKTMSSPFNQLWKRWKVSEERSCHYWAWFIHIIE